MNVRYVVFSLSCLSLMMAIGQVQADPSRDGDGGHGFKTIDKKENLYFIVYEGSVSPARKQAWEDFVKNNDNILFRPTTDFIKWGRSLSDKKETPTVAAGADKFVFYPKTEVGGLISGSDFAPGPKDMKDAIYATSNNLRPIELAYDGISFNGNKYIDANGLNAQGKTIAQVGNGQVEKDSKDAVNGGQLWEVKQLIGNATVDMTPIYRVGALSAAMAGLQPLPFDKDHRFSMSAALGHYHGQNAVAVGMGYYFKRNLRVNAGASIQNSRDKMFNLGLAYRLGGSSDAENFIAANELNHSQGEIQRLNQEVITYQNKMTQLESELAKTKGSMAQALKDMQKQINELKQLIQKKN